MSILSEVQRIQNAKQKLRKALIRKGINIPETYLLNEYNVDIDPITKGDNLTYLTKELNYLTFKWVEDGAFYWKVNYNNSANDDTFNRTIEYCKNNGSWTSITSTENGFVCDVVAGDEIWVRGNNTGYTNTSQSNDYCYFGICGKCYISGNIASLLNWASELTDTYCFNSLFMEANIDIDIDKGLLLPFTTLTQRCYQRMFKNCKLLTNAPYLPATETQPYCYCDMFWGCSSLTIVQDTLQGSISYYCYSSMFRECTSLIKAPYLPANILSGVNYSGCYQYMFADCINLREVQDTLSIKEPNNAMYAHMFQNCKNLRNAPGIHLYKLQSECCAYMFDGCVNLNNIRILITQYNDITYHPSADKWVRNVAHHGIFIKSSLMTLDESLSGTSWAYDSSSDYRGIPANWVIEDMPETEFKIEAVSNLIISFPNNCEYNFGRGWKQYTGGTTLNAKAGDEIYFKTNITPTSQSGIGTFSITGTFNICGNILSLIDNENLSDNDYAFKNLFMGCTGLVDATDLVLPNDISEDCYLGMFKNCTGLINPPTLPATTLAQSCYKEMFYGCTSLLVAPSLPAITLTQSCYESMFYGCISLVNAPDLMATTLVQDCYKQMFYNCSSLQLITSMNDTALGTTYSNNWVYGVNSTGIFNKDYYAGWTIQYGDSYVPTGWEVPINYSTLYFTIESLEDSNTISIVKAKSPSNINLSYSTDDGTTWTDLTISATTTFTTINTGDKIIFKGTNNRLATAWDNYYRFNGSKTFNAYGNIMSLLNGDNFVNTTELNSSTDNHFAGLFYGTTTLIDANKLYLSASTLYYNSYNGMFRGCTNLKSAPQIQATIAANECCSSMFEGCINLEVAPELNFTTLAQNCCKRMFLMDRNNKITTPKMVKAPILRCAATVSGCYEEMFKGNGNLIEVTCLKADNTTCTTNWLLNTSSTGTFKKASGKSWAAGTSGIPSGWTVEDYVEPE